MATRLGLVVLLLLAMTLANIAESTSPSFYDAYSGRSSIATLAHGGDDGLLGDTIDLDEEMMLDSESARRTLRAGNNYISYGAMNKNNVPCNRRGNSYYNCNHRGKANRYTRGCNRISKCARRA